MKKPIFRSQQGMSIVELMIAITLSLVLMLGVFEIFSASKQSNRIQNALGQLQSNARFALDIISYDIRMAGQIGCNSSVDIANSTGSLADFGGGITGYEHSDAQNNLPAIMLVDNPGNPANDDVKNDTDVIFTRYAAPASFVIDSATNTAITLEDDDHGITEGAPLIVSDCQNSEVFTAGGINDTQINIGNGTFGTTYGSDAELARLVYRTYYIREASNTLYRRDVAANLSDGTTVIRTTPILENFEDMQILYGIDINGDGSAIKYVDANAVTNADEWDQVSSIRLTLVLSTEENNVATTDQAYWVNGTSTNPAANDDNKIFRAFTTTINLRNKGLDT